MSVLLVDDRPDVTSTLRLNLQDEGWRILTANSGAEALQLLNQEDDIEVLASDFNMPGMDGAQLIDQALALRPGLYTVVFTAYENRDYAIDSLRVGADDFVEKDKEFFDKVAQAICRGIQQITIERMGRKLLELENKRDVLDLVFRTLRGLERFDGFCLATRRAEGGICRVERAVDLRSGEERPANSALSDDSAYRYVIDSGRVFLPPVFTGAGLRPLFEDSQSIIIVPLLGEESALGIEHQEVGRFKIEDLRLLQRLAQWVALALANIRILRERKRRKAEQGLLARALLHEIKNPLNNIGMMAQAGVDLGAKDLEDLVANVNRIRQALERTLGQAIQHDQVPQTVALDKVLEETISRFRYYYPESGIVIELDSASPLPSISGQREELITAFMNLLQNSAEATSHQGRLIINAHFVPLRQQIELDFIDDGQGIPAEELHRIFDYGYSSRGEGHFGQGLAFTQEFVQRHGGEITVASQQGAGTTFRVVFPIPADGSEPLSELGHAEA